MGRQIIHSFALLALVACSNPEPPQEQAIAPPVLLCGKDTDCKSDRICNAGQCVAPDPASVIGEKSPNKKEVAQSAQLGSKNSSDPVPVCKAGDNRTRIPVWEPSLDKDGLLTSDPPQEDGQVVFIQLDTDRDDVLAACITDEELHSFSQTPADADPGGLWVNIRGNTQFSQGTCYFKGYYINEEVLGMHGGWTETYFKAVEKEKIITSNKYCLAKAID